MVEIKHCDTDSDFSLALKITKDYIEWLDMDLSFQDVNRELACFSTMYAPPNGLFLLAREAGELAAGIGLRMLSAEICEMKRLFVYERFRRRHIAHALCKELIHEAKEMGYAKMRLDTLGRMKAAMRLYEELGFRDIEPYRFNPDPTTRYMELRLK
jgi:ribosomal protein S18 acetylase RimI-like enzyme